MRDKNAFSVQIVFLCPWVLYRPLALGVHGLKLQKIVVGLRIVDQRPVDIVATLVHNVSFNRSLVEIGDLRCETAIAVVFVIGENLGHLHSVNQFVSFCLRAEANDPISQTRRSPDRRLAVSERTATPKWIRRESRVMRDNV